MDLELFTQNSSWIIGGSEKNLLKSYCVYSMSRVLHETFSIVPPTNKKEETRDKESNPDTQDDGNILELSWLFLPWKVSGKQTMTSTHGPCKFQC